MGVRCSFGGETNGSVAALLEAMNHVLSENAVECYDDPKEQPRVYRGRMFGRSALDHHSPRVLAEMAAMAESFAPCPHLALLRNLPHRVVFLPRDLAAPFSTQAIEKNDADPAPSWTGSLPQLLQELAGLAKNLRIPLTDGKLSDETAHSINTFRPFHELDSTKLIESYRTAWLALYEGARLALENGVALTLAG